MKKKNIYILYSKIYIWLKEQYDTIERHSIKKQILHALPFWVGALITGIVAVFYAQLFIWAEKFTRFIFDSWAWAFFFITPLCFVVSWLIVDKFANMAKGSGIPQVTAALELTNPLHYKKVESFLSLRIIIVKVLSSLVMVLGGGVIGREGPTIQVSAAICKKINDWLPAWYPKIARKNMIVTGAAAGLSAAFNTPLGGIVFAIEELTKLHFNVFKSALLVSVIIAGLTALNLLGPYLYLGYPTLSNMPLWIIPLVIITGSITGFTCSIMGRMILYVFRKNLLLKTFFKKILFLIIGGLIIACISFFISKEILGTGKESTVSLLFTNDKYVTWYTPILRFIGTVISFSAGSAGGIFAPSLSLGASIGSVLASWFQLASSQTNLIILCGMAAGLTGITRSPFTSSILIIEMTNSHNIIFHLLLTCLVANFAATFVSRKSFYTLLKDKYLKEINYS